jgi:NAD(P)H dehydrogenase (quinone)
MFAVMGVTGNVGGEVARNLLAGGAGVRAVVREERKGEEWRQRGCEIAVADIHDAESLKRAFAGTEGAFVLVPPVFDPQPGFPEAQSVAASVRAAIEAARPGKVVYLSTIGAQANEENLLTQHTMIEEALRDVATPIAFLRPGWFMENAAWDVAPARKTGVIPSFLFPLDKPVAMVATADIGRVAAELLPETWTGHRVVELEGPKRTTPNEIAETFAKLLDKPVRMEAVPRASWEQLFLSQGMTNPGPRIRMLDGFNEGWNDFEGGAEGTRKGVVTLEAVLKKLVGGKYAG